MPDEPSQQCASVAGDAGCLLIVVEQMVIAVFAQSFPVPAVMQQVPEVACTLDQTQWSLLDGHVSYVDQAIIAILQYQDIPQVDGAKQDTFCVQCDQVSCQLVQIVITVGGLGETVTEGGSR
jgi:hypothetical protein